MPTIETLGGGADGHPAPGSPHVAPRCGGPAGSAKPRTRPGSTARLCACGRLCDRRPVLDDPAGNRLLVALGSHPDGPLHAPAQAAQDAPHVPRVVAHPSKPPDHLGDAPKRPQFLVEAVPPGPLAQGPFELDELDGGELGRAALAGGGAQGPSPALLPAGMPTAGNLGWGRPGPGPP